MFGKIKTRVIVSGTLLTKSVCGRWGGRVGGGSRYYQLRSKYKNFHVRCFLNISPPNQCIEVFS